jgi:hypothetical protein
MDKVGGFEAATAMSGGAVVGSLLTGAAVTGAVVGGGAGTDVGCGAGTADGDAAVPPANECSGALTINLAPPCFG